MKNLFLTLVLALTSVSVFAQKPIAGSKTAEVNLNFQVGTAPINYDLPAELRFRYFLADKTAFRLRLGLGSNTSKSAVLNGAGDVTSDITNKSGLGLNLGLGLEKHFDGTEKLSPYVGAQLGFLLGGKATTDVTNSTSASPNPGQVVSGHSYKSESGSTFGIGLGLYMGADYYIKDNVFIGGEFGLGLFSSSSTAEGSTTVNNGVAETTVKAPKSSTSSLFGVSTGGVRLGFVF